MCLSSALWNLHSRVTAASHRIPFANGTGHIGVQSTHRQHAGRRRAINFLDYVNANINFATFETAYASTAELAATKHQSIQARSAAARFVCPPPRWSEAASSRPEFLTIFDAAGEKIFMNPELPTVRREWTASVNAFTGSKAAYTVPTNLACFVQRSIIDVKGTSNRPL